MALKTELMAKGAQAFLANSLGFDTAATGLTATGSNQAGALALISNFSVFTTVASSTGALLPSALAKAPYVIYNGGSNPLTVYPNGSETINNGATSFSVTNGKSATFWAAGTQWIAVLSA